MTSMIIEYDLCSPGRNYDELYKAIKAYGTWAHITESTWFIKTNNTCVEVRDNLLAHMDSKTYSMMFLFHMLGRIRSPS